MRNTLRELLLLLLMGQADPFGLQSTSGGSSVPLPYAELENLRPSKAASSWRGAAMKAQDQHWVIKSRFQGSTALQLTHVGVERAWDELPSIRSLRSEPETHTWTLGLVQPISPGKSQSVLSKATVRLEHSGAWRVAPNIVIWPRRWYDESVTQAIRQEGALVCCLSVDPEKAAPVTLKNWMLGEQSLQMPLRQLEKAGSDVVSLLSEVKDKKDMKQQRKKRFGNVWLSGLAALQGVSWQETLDSQVEREAIMLMERLTELSHIYRQHIA